MILFEICYIYKLKVAFGDVFEPQTAVNYIPVIDPLNDSQIGRVRDWAKICFDHHDDKVAV
jgi:hypothetical protein